MIFFPIYHKYLAIYIFVGFWRRVCQEFSFHGSTFGLSGAPFIFTELLKPLGTHLRGQGIPITMFSDDGIGAGESLNSAKINSSIVRAGVSRCGFKINKEKSNWVGARKFSWIGCNIDNQTGLISASGMRMEKLLSDPEACSVLDASASIHVKKIASVDGQIYSWLPRSRNSHANFILKTTC